MTKQFLNPDMKRLIDLEEDERDLIDYSEVRDLEVYFREAWTPLAAVHHLIDDGLSIYRTKPKQEAVNNIEEMVKQKFTSGNSVQVDRITITRQEYEELTNRHN